jgi:hypothetical protein
MVALFPIQKPTKILRITVLIGSALFSGLIWWQQSLARKEHAGEFEKLPSKIASEVVKIVPKGFAQAQAQTQWGLSDEKLALLSVGLLLPVIGFLIALWLIWVLLR